MNPFLGGQGFKGGQQQGQAFAAPVADQHTQIGVAAVGVRSAAPFYWRIRQAALQQALPESGLDQRGMQA
jgi:hypothetical protein